MRFAVLKGERYIGLTAAAYSFVLAATVQSAPAVEPLTTGPNSSGALEEVVVTARKREENLQATPISIAAFSGADLGTRDAARIDALAQFVPNLVLQENPGAGGSASNAAVFIRGVGQSDFIPTVDPGVGIYLDGVYLARSVGSLLDLMDIDRVEVLRGPQGTLFGRNTIGGAVNITSLKPDFSGFASKLGATFGTANHADVKAWMNLPIASDLAVTLSVGHFGQGGYVDQPADGESLGNTNTLVGRAALRWKSGPLEVLFSVDGTRTRENGPAFTLRGVSFASSIFNPQHLPLLPPGSLPLPGHYVVNPPADAPVDNFALFNNYVATLVNAGNCLGIGAPTYNPAGDPANPACYGPQYARESSKENLGTFPSFSDDNLWGTALTIDWSIADDVSLRSITAYRHLNSDFQRDGDESPLTIYQLADQLSDRQFSEELQLQGDSFNQALKWIAGVYYFNEKADNANTIDFAPIEALSGGLSATTSWAGFAQATYNLTSQLSITGGARYTRDSKTFLPIQYVLDSKGGPFPDGTPLLPEVEVQRVFSKATPMVNIADQLDPNFMIYATFSEGFKSGGFTQRVFPPLPATPSFNPETVRSYEIGLKTIWLDDTLRVNIAGFHTDYDDIQVQIFRDVAPVTANGGKARINGFEFESQWAPGAGWRLEVNAGLTDARYTEIDPDATELNLSSKFALVSKWTYSLAVQKQFTLAAGGYITPRVDWSYRSSYYNDALNTPALFQPGYGLLGASVSWDSPQRAYGVVAGLRNALNKDYTLAGYFSPSSGTEEVIPSRGREWYVTLKAQF
ncbi:MAG TPA: TonB-dependent receptor [Steroidobacteraceae bacterium]|nr:TonB-dependent receptor [Steroidobacteraceae bacterium]